MAPWQETLSALCVCSFRSVECTQCVNVLWRFVVSRSCSVLLLLQLWTISVLQLWKNILVSSLTTGPVTLFTARRHASALAVRPVSHSRPILRKSGCPLVSTGRADSHRQVSCSFLENQPRLTLTNHNARNRSEPTKTGLQPVLTGWNRLEPVHHYRIWQKLPEIWV